MFLFVAPFSTDSVFITCDLNLDMRFVLILNYKHVRTAGLTVQTTALPTSPSLSLTIQYYFFIRCKSCPFWFVDSPFCCKCSYDLQQEDICIKPRSIGFQVWKVLLVKIRLMKQSSPKLQNVWRNGTLDLWTSSFLL